MEFEESNGLGNLADELAEAFDEDEESYHEEQVVELQCNGAKSSQQRLGENVLPPSMTQASRERSLSPPKQPIRSRNHRRQNSQYDGSDYGDESDLESTFGISPGLEARMAAIESLARRGTEANGSDTDDVVQRVVNYLQDLGSQSNIENNASRLITAHAALTSHLSNQTRTLSTLTHPILSPLSVAPDPEFIDEILPLLTTLLINLPTPSSQPLSALHNLSASTNELTSLLTYLSDTLHMTRQTTSLASRRLRSATEMVVEMRHEAEARDEDIRWIEKGGWEQKLAGRECAKVCGEVMGGFEDTCTMWRERLVGGLEVGA